MNNCTNAEITQEDKAPIPENSSLGRSNQAPPQRQSPLWASKGSWEQEQSCPLPSQGFPASKELEERCPLPKLAFHQGSGLLPRIWYFPCNPKDPITFLESTLPMVLDPSILSLDCSSLLRTLHQAQVLVPGPRTISNPSSFSRLQASLMPHPYFLGHPFSCLPAPPPPPAFVQDIRGAASHFLLRCSSASPLGPRNSLRTVTAPCIPPPPAWGL